MIARKPAFSSPIRWSAGTRQPAKRSCAVSLHHQPILASGVRSSPGASPGTAMSEMPAAPLLPVRTATVIQSARTPEVMKVFSPSITQASPSRRALQASRATSEPPPGSVMASAAIFRPASTSGTMRRFSASLPWATIGGRPIECENRLAIRPPLPARATSSVATRRSRMVAGVPPYSSG